MSRTVRNIRYAGPFRKPRGFRQMRRQMAELAEAGGIRPKAGPPSDWDDLRVAAWSEVYLPVDKEDAA